MEGAIAAMAGREKYAKEPTTTKSAPLSDSARGTRPAVAYGGEEQRSIGSAKMTTSLAGTSILPKRHSGDMTAPLLGMSE